MLLNKTYKVYKGRDSILNSCVYLIDIYLCVFHMSDTALVAAGGDDKVPALMKIAF